MPALLAIFAYPNEIIHMGISDYHAVCNLAPAFCSVDIARLSCQMR